MSFRKEMKFRVSVYDALNLRNSLLSQGMRELHPERTVSSIYFDTRSYKMFYESEEGILPRKKYRVRWYDDEPLYSKEVKVSSVEGRFKTSTTLSSVMSEKDILKMPLNDGIYGHITSVLKVSYVRSYYQFKEARITFDGKISYQNCKVKTKSLFFDPENVVEIKVPFHCGDDYIQSILGHPTERFSKYSRGLLITGKGI